MRRWLVLLALGVLAGCSDDSKSDNADSTPVEVHCAAEGTGKMLTSTTVRVNCPPP
jgi:hypothetical protein